MNTPYMSMSTKRLFSGMRPTGKLHLGHWVGALENWVGLQDTYQCVFSVADWHAFMGEYADAQGLHEYSYDMVLDWLACGVDPERSIIFIQSQVPLHLELQMIFGCLTPLGWLERNPTYKEQLREIVSRDLQTYGFLGYPVLQAADILLYKATAVPVGEDQLPHLELTREIARRFNHLYQKDIFADCDAVLTKMPRLPGIDGRKMSKSYGNAVNLSDTEEEIAQKITQMVTDPARIKLKDPGHPDVCSIFAYYHVFAPEMADEVRVWCEGAQKGCTECKKILAEKIISRTAPIRKRRLKFAKTPDVIADILEDGRKRAQIIAEETMDEVRLAVFKRKRTGS